MPAVAEMSTSRMMIAMEALPVCTAPELEPPELLPPPESLELSAVEGDLVAEVASDVSGATVEVSVPADVSG